MSQTLTYFMLYFRNDEANLEGFTDTRHDNTFGDGTHNVEAEEDAVLDEQGSDIEPEDAEDLADKEEE